MSLRTARETAKQVTQEPRALKFDPSSPQISPLRRLACGSRGLANGPDGHARPKLRSCETYPLHFFERFLPKPVEVNAELWSAAACRRFATHFTDRAVTARTAASIRRCLVSGLLAAAIASTCSRWWVKLNAFQRSSADGDASRAFSKSGGGVISRFSSSRSSRTSIVSPPVSPAASRLLFLSGMQGPSPIEAIVLR